MRSLTTSLCVSVCKRGGERLYVCMCMRVKFFLGLLVVKKNKKLFVCVHVCVCMCVCVCMDEIMEEMKTV